MTDGSDLPAREGLCPKLAPEYTDELTGYSNRKWLIDNLSGIIDNNPGDCGLLFIDIDGLKTENDRYGHEAGDQLIIKTAQTIYTNIRHPKKDRPGDIVGHLVRLSGDELVVILFGVKDNVGVENAKHRIQNNLAENYIEASVGCALHDKAKSQTASDLLKQADLAMLEDKDIRKRAKIEQLSLLKRLAVKVGGRLLKYAGINPPRQ